AAEAEKADHAVGDFVAAAEQERDDGKSSQRAFDRARAWYPLGEPLQGLADEGRSQRELAPDRPWPHQERERRAEQRRTYHSDVTETAVDSVGVRMIGLLGQAR